MSTPRNSNINYAEGWFFVTTQVAQNKSIFGVIADKCCVLNDLGRSVEAIWKALPARFPTLRQDAFVLMPNHVHAIVQLTGTSPGATTPGTSPGATIPYRTPGVHPQGLSSIMGAFKSLAAREYLALLKARQCPDIGPHLWLHSFYDNLITSQRELENIRAYIRDNPARWDDDRFGPVTTYSHGNLDLLAHALTAFVASEMAEAPSHLVPPGFIPGESIISTFTSPEERAVLAWCLQTRTPFVHVYPGGIPDILPQRVSQACAEAQALLLSPVASGTGVNKQRAIWCNRYVLSHASAVRTGTIRPGGSLETLIRSCPQTRGVVRNMTRC